MSTMGRHTPCSRSSRRHRVLAQRLTRFVQQASRLLCWSLTAGMITAAADLLLVPQADWWHMLWPLPWYLTCLSAPLWATLRTHEKAAHQQAPEEDNDIPCKWEQAA
ncbi:hypothetical protein [Streptomyces rochei]|uniref:hypothetical protein n=1 Tax=Streptomyces rochei TaxID=1928 RepID=UPI002949A005|nr:hypothetical protein [Streptomyces sp. UP1A-1]